ncbi:hypothetical protein RINTHH_15890 [Richelia intracellularis HH01]|uniref:Uncharacterized protein n=1 Tax=Richelia intracellularis HH01 TaxID=1165094 RepID=M1WT24_9NOST|nr:hypothetical protein RINTHH_15890 [Richelia intracellularis HH01]
MYPGDVSITCADVSDIVRGADFQPNILIDVGIQKFINLYTSYC